MPRGEDSRPRGAGRGPDGGPGAGRPPSGEYALPGGPAGGAVVRREVVVRQRVGTHLRVVKRIFEACRRLDAELTIASPQHRASAASMLDLMQLAARTGDRLRIESRGPDAERAASIAAAILQAADWDAEVPDE